MKDSWQKTIGSQNTALCLPDVTCYFFFFFLVREDFIFGAMNYPYFFPCDSYFPLVILYVIFMKIRLMLL